MNDAEQYKRADVGRCRFSDKNAKPADSNVQNDGFEASDSPVSSADEKQLCAPTGKAEIQKDAISIGDVENFKATVPVLLSWSKVKNAR